MWEQLHNGLRAFIAKRVANEAETEDLLQNIFLKVHQHADTLQEPERLVSWVFQVTRNAIVDHYRSAERRRYQREVQGRLGKIKFCIILRLFLRCNAKYLLIKRHRCRDIAHIQRDMWSHGGLLYGW